MAWGNYVEVLARRVCDDEPVPAPEDRLDAETATPGEPAGRRTAG